MNTDMRDRLVELGADLATTLVLSMGANVTAIGPLAAAAEDGQSGLLTTPGSAEALATELGRLLRDPHLCAVLGRAAVTRAENFSVDAIGGRYVALLDEVRVRKKGETAGLLAPS